jgi:hypothetical protein
MVPLVTTVSTRTLASVRLVTLVPRATRLSTTAPVVHARTVPPAPMLSTLTHALVLLVIRASTATN